MRTGAMWIGGTSLRSLSYPFAMAVRLLWVFFFFCSFLFVTIYNMQCCDVFMFVMFLLAAKRISPRGQYSWIVLYCIVLYCIVFY